MPGPECSCPSPPPWQLELEEGRLFLTVPASIVSLEVVSPEHPSLDKNSKNTF